MRNFFLILTWLFLFASGYANATFMLSTTRVIHTEIMKESTFEVYNNSDNIILIQAWLESDRSGAPPFALSPPLVKIKPKKSNTFRIFYQGTGLPKDKESYFWINVLAIPKTTTEHDLLQVAIQQSIKIFYRPTNLPGDARSATEFLKLLAKDNLLVVQNPTPYYVNISSFRQGGVEFDGDMIPPYGQGSIPAVGMHDSGKVEVSVINDFGGQDTFEGILNSGVSDKLKLKQ